MRSRRHGWDHNLYGRRGTQCAAPVDDEQKMNGPSLAVAANGPETTV
ncbi:hypothetical protein HMPREF3227_02248 [Corynebacterium sp. CMW7794]|nr:hypothetical protein HMPREF0307_01265 [Corynebacterium sp. DNF00584]KXI15946.1 hypothetical protein HMPREF3227_02248 [Corynebacterium sp. CMW7794]